jgi:polysaccharide biosynthesis transport protein
MKSNADTAVMVDGDLDLGSLGAALVRRRHWIIWPTLLIAIIASVAVNLVAPRYKSEARLVYDGRENVFLRPEAEKPLIEDRSPADAETLTDQVQIVLSRALALDVIGALKLGDLPEFDPVLNGVSQLREVLIAAGLTHNLLAMTPQERVLESWYDRLAVYPVEKSRVIVIEFQSTDPVLAAQITNAITADYLRQQQAVRQQQTRDAGQWLSGEIENLRHKVADAEAKVEDFRSRTNLFVGTNNTTLSGQQLGEFNSQVATARGQKADAETRSRIIADMLRKGEPINASDVVNSELIRRLSEQRVTLRAQLAEQSSTLLDGHPRIKELKAQIADLDRQIRTEAERLTHVLENEARIAGARLDALNSSLDALKKQAAATNGEDVELRALEREAKAQRDLLESYLLRYRETMARESIGNAPADAKVISAAIPSNTPYFPKKVPIVAVATLITFLMCCGLVTTSELLRASAPRRRLATDLVPVDASSAFSLSASAQRDSIERMAAAVDRTHAHLVHGSPGTARAGSPEAAQGHPATAVADGSAPAGESVTSPAGRDGAGGSGFESQPANAEMAQYSFPAPDASDEPMTEPHTEQATGSAQVLGVPLNAIKDVAIWLGQPGGASQRVAFMSATTDLPTSLPAVRLARTLAANSRVVVVGLIRRAPVLEAISTWPDMPGLSDVISGVASFGQIISKDKLSRVHVVHYGRSELPIEALLNARQFAVMMEALRRAYDHVIIDAGTISGDCFRLAAVASRCVLIARDRTEPATTAAFQMLSGAGFTEIAIMTGSTTQPHGRVAA